jgi:hypothetical protein
MKHPVTVHLSGFACQVVAGEGGSGAEHVPARVIRAIRCYLSEKGPRGTGWSYPRFMRDEKPADDVALQLDIDDDLWRSLEEEAERQGVSPQKMVTHAALYVAAEVNAGRLTRRILDGLEEEEGKPGG